MEYCNVIAIYLIAIWSLSKYCNIELRQSNTNILQYLFIFLQYLKIYWDKPLLADLATDVAVNAAALIQLEGELVGDPYQPSAQELVEEVDGYPEDAAVLVKFEGGLGEGPLPSEHPRAGRQGWWLLHQCSCIWPLPPECPGGVLSPSHLNNLKMQESLAWQEEVWRLRQS